MTLRVLPAFVATLFFPSKGKQEDEDDDDGYPGDNSMFSGPNATREAPTITALESLWNRDSPAPRGPYTRPGSIRRTTSEYSSTTTASMVSSSSAPNPVTVISFQSKNHAEGMTMYHCLRGQGLVDPDADVFESLRSSVKHITFEFEWFGATHSYDINIVGPSSRRMTRLELAKIVAGLYIANGPVLDPHELGIRGISFKPDPVSKSNSTTRGVWTADVFWRHPRS